MLTGSWRKFSLFDTDRKFERGKYFFRKTFTTLAKNLILSPDRFNITFLNAKFSVLRLLFTANHVRF